MRLFNETNTDKFKYQDYYVCCYLAKDCAQPSWGLILNDYFHHNNSNERTQSCYRVVDNIHVMYYGLSDLQAQVTHISQAVVNYRNSLIAATTTGKGKGKGNKTALQKSSSRRGSVVSESDSDSEENSSDDSDSDIGSDGSSGDSSSSSRSSGGDRDRRKSKSSTPSRKRSKLYTYEELEKKMDAMKEKLNDMYEKKLSDTQDQLKRARAKLKEQTKQHADKLTSEMNAILNSKETELQGMKEQYHRSMKEMEQRHQMECNKIRDDMRRQMTHMQTRPAAVTTVTTTATATGSSGAVNRDEVTMEKLISFRANLFKTAIEMLSYHRLQQKKQSKNSSSSASGSGNEWHDSMENIHKMEMNRLTVCILRDENYPILTTIGIFRDKNCIVSLR